MTHRSDAALRRFGGHPEKLDRAVFDRFVDYAGLFPPASLPMRWAVEGFLQARSTVSASTLGRFIVPLAHIEALDTEVANRHMDGAMGTVAMWPLSVIASRDPTSVASAVRAFNTRHASVSREGIGPIVAVEARIQTPDDIGDWSDAFRGTLGQTALFLEVPGQIEAEPILARLAAVRTIRPDTHAKIRTGGVTAPSIPSAERIARFLTLCREHAVMCKATAGLHHALPGEYPLTYEPDSASGTLHGLFNLLLAAALACMDGPGKEPVGWEEIAELLKERCPEAFNFEVQDAGELFIHWRDRIIPEDAIIMARRQLLLAVGSCSFSEPIDELRDLGLM